MLRLVTAYAAKLAPVRVSKLTCQYQALKEGVDVSMDFEVVKQAGQGKDERQPSRKGQSTDNGDGVEAVEFTFVLFDIFDQLLTSIQGIAGPGRYSPGVKKHKAKWLFNVDSAFTQYHALCFPSQARLTNGTVWRCDRDECLAWLNSQIKPMGIEMTEEDVFPADTAREGMRE